MKKDRLLNKMFRLKLSFYSLVTLLALTASCRALQSGLKIENSPSPITVAPTVLESIQTQSFVEWCQRKASVPSDTRHTIDVLLEMAGTNDCKSADGRIRKHILEYGTFLSLSGRRISDLKPISGFTEVTAIFLENNQISDLQPLTNLSNLSTAKLGNNQISDLRPLARMSRLSRLDLRNNRISDVTPLAALSSMEELILDNNQITDLSSLRVLRKLGQLHVRNNPLSDKSCPINPVSTGIPAFPIYSVCRLD
jgi:internalin A